MKVYVASSWKNMDQQRTVRYLRNAGFEVYDFKNPRPGDRGFKWEEIDSEWNNWKPREFIEGLGHPAAERGFGYDMQALEECDACVLLLPCGRSAHLEAGFAAGAPDKKLCILMSGFGERIEPELMYKMADCITTDIDEVVRVLGRAVNESSRVENNEERIVALNKEIFAKTKEISTLTGQSMEEILREFAFGLKVVREFAASWDTLCKLGVLLKETDMMQPTLRERATEIARTTQMNFAEAMNKAHREREEAKQNEEKTL